MKKVITRETNGDGEVVYEHEATTRYVRGPRYAGPWRGSLMLSREGLHEVVERMRDHAVGLQATRVLLVMLASLRVHDGNRVPLGRGDLCRETGMSASNVSASLKKLVECGFVEPPPYRHSPYVISPRLAWFGTVEALRLALAERGLLDRQGMMGIGERRKQDGRIECAAAAAARGDLPVAPDDQQGGAGRDL